ncbi:MAG: AMP-binding protein, partial [Thermoanaerobaculia bacterium]
MAIRTLNELFLAVARRDQPECLLHRVDGAWRPISTAALVADVQGLAAALDGLGVRPGDRVALMAENGPHWPTIDFAALGLGAVLAPIYPTLTSEQAAYIVRDCGAGVVFVQGGERLQGLLAERPSMPQAQHFVLIGAGERPSDVPTLADLLSATPPMAAAEFERRANAIRPGDLATLIYTSGTTGQPKGVMLSHGNLASNIEASLTCLEFRSDSTALSFLPLSHSFERAVDYMYFLRGVTIAYAESVQTVGRDLLEVRPQVFVSVPRVYEKMLARVRESVAASPPLRRRIFAWAERVGRAALP